MTTETARDPGSSSAANTTLVLYGLGGTVATAATLVYHAIALWVPAACGTIAFILLQRTRKQPIVLRNPTERLRGPG